MAGPTLCAADRPAAEAVSRTPGAARSRHGRASLFLLVAGLLVVFVGFVVLGHREALTLQQVLLTLAALVWLAAKVVRRR